MALHFWNRALAALVLVVLAARAEAGLLPTAATVNNNNDGTNRFTYGVVLTSDSTLHTGDYFTVFDFQGLKPGSNVQPANFAFSVSNTGGIPPGVVTTDNPSLPNVTWTYTGTQPLTGQLGLGNFSVISTNQESQTASAFAAITHRQIDGQADSNITDTLIPGSTPVGIQGVPEPATLALVGIGLPFAGLLRRIRRRRA